jgi:hypothetical protein
VTVTNSCVSPFNTGWFVPTITQLQNPGYTCRQYWDLFSSTPYCLYWSSTEINAERACSVYLVNGNPAINFKTTVNCVRAFRCVTY